MRSTIRSCKRICWSTLEEVFIPAILFLIILLQLSAIPVLGLNRRATSISPPCDTRLTYINSSMFANGPYSPPIYFDDLQFVFTFQLLAVSGLCGSGIGGFYLYVDADSFADLQDSTLSIIPIVDNSTRSSNSATPMIETSLFYSLNGSCLIDDLVVFSDESKIGFWGGCSELRQSNFSGLPWSDLSVNPSGQVSIDQSLFVTNPNAVVYIGILFSGFPFPQGYNSSTFSIRLVLEPRPLRAGTSCATAISLGDSAGVSNSFFNASAYPPSLTLPAMISDSVGLFCISGGESVWYLVHPYHNGELASSITFSTCGVYNDTGWSTGIIVYSSLQMGTNCTSLNDSSEALLSDCRTSSVLVSEPPNCAPQDSFVTLTLRRDHDLYVRVVITGGTATRLGVYLNVNASYSPSSSELSSTIIAVIVVLGTCMICAIFLLICMLCMMICVAVILMVFSLGGMGATIFSLGVSATIAVRAVFLFRRKNRERDELVETLRTLQDQSDEEDDDLERVGHWEKYKYRELKWRDIVITSKLGEGAFGKVYLGKWRGAVAAVKLLDSFMTSEEDVNEIRREAALMELLGNHPNIISFVGAITHGSRYAIVTEYARHGSLESYLQTSDGRALTKADRVRISLECALGIRSLHAENVIHRDIAARNILLGYELEAKVSDFGLSRVKESAEKAASTKSNIGPVKWSAPEAIVPPRQYSEKSDAFSFGVLLWEIFTGQTPWADCTAVDVAVAVTERDERMDIPQSVPTTIRHLIRRLWKRRPKSRPDFEQICDALKEYYIKLVGGDRVAERQLQSSDSDDDLEMEVLGMSRKSTDPSQSGGSSSVRSSATSLQGSQDNSAPEQRQRRSKSSTESQNLITLDGSPASSAEKEPTLETRQVRQSRSRSAARERAADYSLSFRTVDN
jgi:serine/threonine protein kinase